MKLKWLVLAAILLFPAHALAGNLTNPALTIGKGKGTLGLEYGFTRGRIKPKDNAGFNLSSAISAGFTEFWETRTIDMHQSYIRGAYGLSEATEIYAKVGLASLKGRNFFRGDPDFNASAKVTPAFGIKQSYKTGKKLRVGWNLQYTYFSGTYENTKSYPFRSGYFIDKLTFSDPMTLDAALAVSRPMGSVAPYAGIVATWRRFKVESSGTIDGTPFSVNTTFTQDSLAGGLVGLDIFWKKIRANVEAQILKKVSAGVSINYLF